MTYPDKKNIDESIHQKLRKRDKYETGMHKIYKLFVGYTNGQLQDKSTSDATYQVFKATQEHINDLNILKKIFFLNKSKHHPIRSDKYTVVLQLLGASRLS